MSARLKSLGAAHPPFKRALFEDVRITLACRGETRRLESRWDVARQAVRLAWTSDAFFAQTCYRAKARLQALGVPVLPRVLHRLAMSSAQVCIGDPVVMEPGVYIAHGQVVLDGFVHVGSGTVLFPWVTIGLVAGEFQGPTLGNDVHVGTGAKVLGPITIGSGARVGANAVVLHDVEPDTTVVGAPATKRPPWGSVVEELVAAGRNREALVFLDGLRRCRSNADVEHRLVALRHEVFGVESPPAGRRGWPPPDPGRFAGVTGLPEVSPAELDADAVASGVVGHGSLIVRGLLSPQHVDQMSHVVRQVLAARDRYEAGESLADDRAWYWPFESAHLGFPEEERGWVRDAGGVLAADSPHGLAAWIDVLEGLGVVELVASYFGERPALSVRKTTFRLVPPEMPGAWHQDGAFLGAGIRSLNLWVALTDCGVDAPSLDVVGRRLDGLVPSGTDGTPFTWTVSDAETQRAASGTVVRPVFAAGDAMLFDELNLHRTAGEPGLSRPRLAIETWFFAPSHYPIEQIPLAL